MGWFGAALPFINAVLAIIVSAIWMGISSNLGLDALEEPTENDAKG